MKTPSRSKRFFRKARIAACSVGLIALVFSLTAINVRADIPDRRLPRLDGMYQVVSSDDPLFPITRGVEWFMDFGKGIHSNTYSGSVAISRRENPDVKVRIMAWQYFPNESALVVGNQFDRGASNAVAQGIWAVIPTTTQIILQRDQFQMVIQRAHPNDY